MKYTESYTSRHSGSAFANILWCACQILHSWATVGRHRALHTAHLCSNRVSDVNSVIRELYVSEATRNTLRRRATAAETGWSGLHRQNLVARNRWGTLVSALYNAGRSTLSYLLQQSLRDARHMVRAGQPSLAKKASTVGVAYTSVVLYQVSKLRFTVYLTAECDQV